MPTYLVTFSTEVSITVIAESEGAIKEAAADLCDDELLSWCDYHGNKGACSPWYMYTQEVKQRPPEDAYKDVNTNVVWDGRWLNKEDIEDEGKIALKIMKEPKPEPAWPPTPAYDDPDQGKLFE